VEARYPDVRVELVKIKTKGDKILDSPLSQVGGKGLFVKEIEDALLKKEVDVAVHSMKDVPTDLPEGLDLMVFPEREDPRDVLIAAGGTSLVDLPNGARIGTSSLRRAAQLLKHRPDIRIISLRGNVDTRLGKIESGELDAIVLAAAGLRRLGLADRATEILEPTVILPAIGQGALGLEMRKQDESIISVFKFLNHGPTEFRVRAERALLKELEGGCQVPIAGHALLEGQKLTLRGLVAELDGSEVIQDGMEGDMNAAEEIGTTLARKLLDAGAGAILQRIYGSMDWK
jgi:hydroxymethylbilane synthase